MTPADGPSRDDLLGPVKELLAALARVGLWEAGAEVVVEYDVPADAWYFHDNGAATMFEHHLLTRLTTTTGGDPTPLLDQPPVGLDVTPTDHIEHHKLRPLHAHHDRSHAVHRLLHIRRDLTHRCALRRTPAPCPASRHLQRRP